MTLTFSFSRACTLLWGRPECELVRHSVRNLNTYCPTEAARPWCVRFLSVVFVLGPPLSLGFQNRSGSVPDLASQGGPWKIFVRLRMIPLADGFWKTSALNPCLAENSFLSCPLTLGTIHTAWLVSQLRETQVTHIFWRLAQGVPDFPVFCSPVHSFLAG